MSQPSAVTIGLTTALLLTFLQAGLIASSPSFVLTRDPYKQTSDESFTCQGKIHGYLTFDEKLKGDHVIEGIWTLPNGRIGHHTKTSITYPEAGRYLAYLWLEFEEEGGGLLSFRDDDEFEKAQADQIYDGTWTLEVKLDGKSVGQTQFDMECKLG